ncbi:MAG: beta-galactosidase [bacterium]|nr:beta-galactosidase [bacterium]
MARVLTQALLVALLVLVCGGLRAQGSVSERTSVRVRMVDGMPRLCVNGRPEVPHFVFTWPVSALPYAVTRDWRRITYRFVSDFDSPRSSAHFRFRREAMPLTVQIRGTRLRDVTSGTTVPLVWDVIPADAVGKLVSTSNDTLVVKLNTFDPAKRGDLHPLTHNFRLEKDHAYEYTFEVRGDVETVVSPAVFRITPIGTHLMVNCPEMSYSLRQIKLARDAGVRFVTCGYPQNWAPPSDDAAEFELIDSFMRGVIQVNPDALILPRINANAPKWWLKAHPEERMCFDDGKGGFEAFDSASPSSRVYRRDLCDYLERLSRHLSAAFPRHLAGIHVAGQHSGEWFYEKAWRRPLCGYDAGSKAAFGRPVPLPEARRKAEIGPFFDPKGDVYAFSRFQNDEMSDLVADMILALRRGLGDDKMTMAFYGYSWELTSLPNGTAWSGHLSLDRLMGRCRGELDALCGPGSYYDRDWAESGVTMSAAETLSRNGVLWLDEDDTRTCRYPEWQTPTGFCAPRKPNDACRSSDCFERNMAKEAIRGFGSWFMDLPGCGALDFPEMWSRIRDFLPRERELLESGAAYSPEIALVVDEKSHSALGGDWRQELTRPLLYCGHADWSRTGVPYGKYLLADVLRYSPEAKLTVFLSPWYLTSAERRTISGWRREGRAGVRVWCRWSGYLTDEGLSTAAMEETTGFAFTVEDKMNPMPICDASEAWERDEKGVPSVVVRKCGAGWDVYVAKGRIEPELGLRLARLAGCHAYLEKPGAAVVWAAGDWTSVHALEDGPTAVDFGTWGKNVLDLRKGETRLFFRGRER